MDPCATFFGKVAQGGAVITLWCCFNRKRLLHTIVYRGKDRFNNTLSDCRGPWGLIPGRCFCVGAERDQPEDFTTKDTTNVVFVFQRVKEEKQP
jgi:hypothetical protein